MIPDSPLKKILEGKSTILLEREGRALSHQMLTFPLRDYVIYKVKLPLQKAIQSASCLAQLTPALLKAASQIHSRVGDITKKNTHSDTHQLIEIWEEIQKEGTIQGREELLNSAMAILQAEVAHDKAYRDLFIRMLVKMVERVNDGRWRIK